MGPNVDPVTMRLGDSGLSPLPAGAVPFPVTNLRGKETLMESHRNFDKDIHVRLKEEHLREFDEVSRRLDITKSELVRLLVQLPTSIVKEGNIRCIYIDQTALRGCFREMRGWGVNLNQAIHALNKIAYELGHGKAPETARVLQDMEAAIIATNACIDATGEAQKLFESFERHPYLAGRKRADVKRGRPRKKRDGELPSDYNERRIGKGKTYDERTIC